MSAQALAKQLAVAILSVEERIGKKVVCSRVALKYGQFGNERDMGGLNHEALETVIAAALIEAGFADETNQKQTAGTMLEEWQGYHKQVYPQGMSSIQHVETHQAFYAGANVMMSQMMALTALPEHLALRGIKVLQNEIIQAAKQRVANGAARN